MWKRACVLAALACVALGGPASASEGATHPPAQDWEFNGLFGTFDLASAQRGLQVYEQICHACHSLNHVAYRHLGELGFNEDEVAAIAANYQLSDGPDENGEMFDRPAEGSDFFVPFFANEEAARAGNGGAYPPDLSLIVKARSGGADYIYAFLTGFEEPPDGEELPAGRYWNEYFPGHQLAMPNILDVNTVEYTDGTEPTHAQMAWDVTNFLAWAAEPQMMERKQMGLKVVLFLLVFTALMYAVKRKVWANVHH
ncbi:MAG: cytochrome c1 [Rhodospirillaceae bacterium]|nr:cytochrome c1 [Rhodospirillaceae bacterium]